MIDPAHKLTVTHQAKLLDLSRSSVYYRPAPTPEFDLALMRRIDELNTSNRSQTHAIARPGAINGRFKRLVKNAG